MTESARHQNSVAKLKTILMSMGAGIKENDNSRGKSGYRYPMIVTDCGPRSYVADIFAIYKGMAIAYEIDLNYHGTQKAYKDDLFRTGQLRAFGIHVIRYTPLMIDTLTAEHALQDIEYFALGIRRKITA